MAKKGAPIGNKFAEGEGRPTLYQEDYDKQAYKLCLLGATDKDLADFFEVTETTINNWKLEHNSFFESIKEGKVKADSVIAHSLFERAKGATVVKQQAFKVRSSEGQGQYTERIEVIELAEEMPPDTQAIKFWLTNRKSSEWRDKVNTELSGEVNVTNLSPEEREKRIAELSAKLIK